MSNTASQTSRQRHGRRSPARLLVAVAASSAAGLVFEVALTRVFAVTQFYHFAFLAVSLALLGFGASGSALAAFPGLGLGGRRVWRRMAIAQSLSTLAAYLVINSLPFDSFSVAWDRTQVLYLAIYYLALSVPFFFGGLLVAALLTTGEEAAGVSSNRAYAASLVGSGIGALMALGALDLLGGEGTIVLAAAMAMTAALAFGPAAEGRLAPIALGLVTLGLVALAVWIPRPLEMNLSPYKGLSAALRYPGSAVVASTWDLGTRIDLVESEGFRSLPGLSLAYSGVISAQDGVAFDGDDLSPVLRGDPADHDFAPWMLGSVAYVLHPGADVLVLEPHGGLDVAIALANGAGTVVAVEPHPSTVDLIRGSGPSAFDDVRVKTEHTTSRSFAERTQERFDVIDLALTAPYRPVASGAYSLAEDYRLTVEAFEVYLRRLAPGGTLTAMRWVQIPPSEETRLVATAATALRNLGYDPSQSIAVLRSYSSAVLLARPSGFSRAQTEAIAEFAEAGRFDIVIVPGLEDLDANRFNVLAGEQYSSLAKSLVASDEPVGVYRASEFEISPPTDDHPFFGHYFKWSQAPDVIESLGRTWQPFGGAGYLVLIALLLISGVAAVVLITAPLLWKREQRGPVEPGLAAWTLGYFALLGVGFLFVEIPLIQHLILLIGNPAAAFAIVLFAILVSSGVGSALSKRIPWMAGALSLTACSLVYPFLLTWITDLALPAPGAARTAIAVFAMAPLGFLMGVMFPKGIAVLEERGRSLVPWAWAINGTVSVISTAAAAVLALTFGFSFVLLAGAGAYTLATSLAWRALTPRSA